MDGTPAAIAQDERHKQFTGGRQSARCVFEPESLPAMQFL
jgi:hypothetical protein